MRPYHITGAHGSATLSSLPQSRRLAGNERSPHYPAEEALKAELDKLPHKIVLNVNEVAKEVGSPRVANIVLLGATIPFLGIDYQKVQDSIRDIFLRKGEAIVELNLKALVAGKEIAENLM